MAVFLHAYGYFLKNRKRPRRTDDELPYYFVRFVAVIDMWLMLCAHGAVVPKVYPLFPENCEYQIAVMTEALAGQGIDYELSFADPIRKMRK